MRNTPFPFFRTGPGSRRGAAWLSLWVAAAGLGVPLGAGAEKADRDKPMEIVADRSSTVNFVNQIGRFNGNVVLTQGTMTLKADRVEVRESSDGYRSATAWGSAATGQVKYRQKRDGVNEYLEGQADRVEFDGKADTLRFIGNGVVRRTNGRETVDEISGELITWDHGAEQFSVQAGGAASAPGGRVRATFAPRQKASEAAAAPTPAAPASAPAPARAPRPAR